MQRTVFIYFAMLIAVLLLPFSNGLAHSPKSYTKTNLCSVEQLLDSLARLELFATDTLKRQKSEHPSSIPDLAYEVKIANIDRLSPISFDFNQHVKRYIDIYTIERREQVGQMLGLAKLYFPLFDEILDKHNLPLELKYLAVVESALNPLAISPSGAVGLWQFKINTGRMFDLEVNSYIDERMDPAKSTEAACKYLEYLYRIFGDWHLVMAAYNAGPGVVRNAIERANGETHFWHLYDYLPEAAQNYVPAFIAAGYVIQNAANHGIVAIPPMISFEQIDSVHVTQPVSFKAISDAIPVTMDILRFLNPSFRRGYVPEPEQSTPILLPTSAIPSFIQNQASIYNNTLPKSTYHQRVANAGNNSNKQKLLYSVKPGDYLHKIAIKHNCTIDDIMVWNPDREAELSAGDTLEIWVNKITLQQISNSQNN
ncbi:MAG TPA: LysM peptidoglycan-binding domain-containing protein [Bacteroidetes bacterium]|nr:LysM peptidoglycan-binding domain-containing protein [Bacteroidota bacterium]